MGATHPSGRLAATGIDATALDGEIVFTTPTLGPALLSAVEELVRPAGTAIHVEQPAMTDVFRQMLAGNGVAP